MASICESVGNAGEIIGTATHQDQDVCGGARIGCGPEPVDSFPSGFFSEGADDGSHGNSLGKNATQS